MGTVGDDDDGLLNRRTSHVGGSVEELRGVQLPRARDAKKRGRLGGRFGSGIEEGEVGEVFVRAIRFQVVSCVESGIA